MQLSDALALPSGFCLLEKRFVDVALRYGIHPHTVDRWKKTLEIKTYFDDKTGGSVYRLLPGVTKIPLAVRNKCPATSKKHRRYDGVFLLSYVQDSICGRPPALAPTVGVHFCVTP